MKKEIIVVEGIGEVTIVSSPRSRNISLRVVAGELKVSKPRLVSRPATLSFIEKNRSWIVEKLAESSQSRLIHDSDILAPNTIVRFKEASGDAEPEGIKVCGGIEVTYPSYLSWQDKIVQEAAVASLVPVWRRSAKSYLPKRLEELARIHSFEFSTVRLKNIHTRWGSCTSTGNINLNIQLMKLDDDLIDHVLLHELSHTKALNHGKDFWRVFESVRPGARQERKQLKQMIIF